MTKAENNMTNNYDDVEMLDEGITADAIEAMHLSVERLRCHYDGGELEHLSETEIQSLLANARTRDLWAATHPLGDDD